MWIPREEDAPQAYKKARARIGTLMDEEYRRLLYVAMTRAEDRLYICGHKGSKTPTEESWYNYINRAFSRLEGAETVPFAADGVEGSALRFSNPQTREPEDKKAHMQQKDGSDCKTGAPKWLFTAAPQEPDPPRPLVPSRAAGFTEPPAASPLAGTQTKARDEFRFRRGNATHRLLQFLPALGSVQRYAAAQAYLAQPGLVLPEDMQRDIAAEVMAILEHPDYAPLFGPGSLAEVPLTGLAGGRIVSGQIDRLVVTPDSVMVVDYKTNRPPPQRQEDIPDIYLKQMQAYRLVLEKIYHGRPVRGLLLWTDGPVLMAVP